MIGVTVNDVLKEKNIVLKLQAASIKKGLKKEIKTREVQRPALAFTGNFDCFTECAVQVLGRDEAVALSALKKDKMAGMCRELFSRIIPCFVATDGVKMPKYFIEAAGKAGVPILRSTLSTTRFINRMFVFLNDRMAPRTTVQGVMVDVYGMGILITGESGIGKSECALELLERGHRLISDDIIGVKQRSGSIIVAYTIGMQHHYVEVRGLGIIDIEDVFGIGSVRNAIRLELVLRLEDWDRAKEYDRLGLEKRTTPILGVEIPEIVVPVTAGRNLAVIIELAAKNQRLKEKGRSAIKELDRELIKKTKKKA